MAAALSDDPEIKAAYSTGDLYLAFAKQAGAVPLEATKSTHKAARDLFKACVLGVRYGMLSDNLALRIGKSTPYAKELLRYHKRIYKTYWN
jgi:DNA polymerase I-like protein with 3'-5' exonuclease and polymerase domains